MLIQNIVILRETENSRPYLSFYINEERFLVFDDGQSDVFSLNKEETGMLIDQLLELKEMM